MADAYEDFTEACPIFDFYFRQIHTGPHKNFTYVIGDTVDHQAIIVDPTFEMDRVFADVEADGYRITRALFTHGHWDHIGGVPDIAKLGVEKIGLHEAAAEHPKVAEAKDAGMGVRLFRDGERFDLGGIPVQILHTPGHQPESTCFLVGDEGWQQALLTGDTLFVGSCGRTDFPGGDTAKMFASMHRLRSMAAPDLHVMPGHHYAKTNTRPLSDEVRDNPALSTTDRAAFGELMCLTD